jgi:hypothetical protein
MDPPPAVESRREDAIMAQTKAKKPAAKKRTSGSSTRAQSKPREPEMPDSGSEDDGAPSGSRLKVPLVAGAAAAAGVAGAILANRSGRKRKALGVSMPKRPNVSLPKMNGLKPDARKLTGTVIDVAQRADDLGQNMSRIAGTVKRAGEAADKAMKR